MNKDGILGVVMVAVSGLLLWSSSGLTSATKWDVMGPGAYPRAILWLILAASVGLILTSLSNKGATKASASAARPADRHVGLVPLVFALLFAYVLLLPLLGFMASSIGFLLIVQWLLFPPGKKQWITLATIAVAFPVAAFFLFEKVLGIYLPRFAVW